MIKDLIESGGTIRALTVQTHTENTVFATGVSATETADEVQLRGSQIRFQNLQGNIATAFDCEGDTLTGVVSGATATAIDVVKSTRKLKIEGGNGRLFSREKQSMLLVVLHTTLKFQQLKLTLQTHYENNYRCNTG